MKTGFAVGSIEQLKQEFLTGMESLPEEIFISEKLYTIQGSTTPAYNVNGTQYCHYKTVEIEPDLNAEPFSVSQQATTDLVLEWVNDKLTFKPHDVYFINFPILVEGVDSIIDDQQNKRIIIQDKCNLVLVGFNDNEAIPAKVDTGASQCSIHGEDIKWSTDNDLVQFTFNKKRYRMTLAGEQDISSSDGGTQKRPVVTFRVKMDGMFLDGISFNINDRSNMPDKILIGQNLLEQGNFLIDPSGNKEESDDSVEQYKNKKNAPKEAPKQGV